MKQVDKGLIAVAIISTIGGIVVPQLLLPGYFSGVTDQSPSWGQLVFYTYLGIIASIGGAILFTVLFRAEKEISKLLVRFVQTTALSITWLCVLSYAIFFVTEPVSQTWSISDTILLFFQYPAYASVYSTYPALIWFISVLLYNLFYIMMVRTLE